MPLAAKSICDKSPEISRHKLVSLAGKAPEHTWGFCLNYFKPNFGYHGESGLANSMIRLLFFPFNMNNLSMTPAANSMRCRQWKRIKNHLKFRWFP